MANTTRAAARKPKQPATTSTSKSRARNPRGKVAKKRYVLDTNVLLHDPTSLLRFEENDISIPLVVLEELDRHKKGITDLARNARQATRTLDTLLEGSTGSMLDGFPLEHASDGRATGKLYFHEALIATKSGMVPAHTVRGLTEGKPDNQILECAQQLLAEGQNAILVTKDINLRVKALACGVPAQDFRSDRVLLSDEDVLSPGFRYVNSNFWAEQVGEREGAFTRRNGRQYVAIPLQLPVNSFLLDESRARWRVESSSEAGSVLYQLTHGEKEKQPSLLTPRNNEQALALALLYDNDVDLVALLGLAGSGKTLLALASGLEQVKLGRFKEVLITRATVPLGEEIGFLPGDEQEKMDPWIGGTLRDVYEVLGLTDPKDPLRQKVEVNSMAFMRGRSFQGKYIIIDEAQNLTQRQMRALVTRAGDGSKVVLTGNLGQIDNNFVDEGTSGLTWAVKKIENWKHAGHLILPRGERSRLATYFEEASEYDDEGGRKAA
ncbi:PhoH family protein [Paraburkholderia sp. EG287A]|uniref:PhoH family protein n=1 Tax=Paraburkholderia sp. EG287A TaxID=3237012 RepID=UPI0034D3759C